ncbi:hypothetical protein L1D32_10545 [Shewanella insulae]|uniref:hypothetical protein n=1 Tax=Shewanella insulae TaxID=2681496 RepID=UPI001EFC800F|nr:hypothetical protein [Shewanella insulae]MCG9738594.1 hypothetical protein [Shewanella insulae]
MKNAIKLLFLSVLLVGTSASAEQNSPNIESYMYSGFKTIKTFSSIDVYLQGSAEEIGLSKEELTSYLRLRFKNNFASTGFKKGDFVKIITEESETKKAERGDISIKVWTVGDDYPIAFHIEIGAGNYSNLGQYKTAILGYSSKQKIAESVKQSISDLVDDLAVAFFKARGEL